MKYSLNFKKCISFLNIRINHIKYAWKEELKDPVFCAKLISIPVLFLTYSWVTQHLGSYIQNRKGMLLADPFLAFFPKADYSGHIFLLLYSSVLIVIISHASKPGIILRLVQMHFAVAVCRQLCILSFALEPPVDIIILRDILLENTVYPHAPLTKDLFFSGHVASIWIYFLYTRSRPLKYCFALATIIMGWMILCMRVHYTYDILGALLFTSIIYLLFEKVKYSRRSITPDFLEKTNPAPVQQERGGPTR